MASKKTWPWQQWETLSFRGRGLLWVVALGVGLVAFAAPALLADDEDDGSRGKASSGEEDSGGSPARKYVLENIERALNTTTFKQNQDGSVTMTFSFRQKKDDMMRIFTPPMKPGLQSKFRYTVTQEEIVIGGDEGIRLSDKGMALLDCWFIDAVEAEAEMLCFVNHKPTLTAALTFWTDRHRALGSNYGTQCGMFRRGRPVKRVGKTKPIAFNQTAKVGFKMQGGVFQAKRDGRDSEKLKYKREDFQSGRVGFLWGGSTALIVPTLKITGHLDYAKMAKEIKEKLGDS